MWEFPTAFWLEQHGYDVTYISNHDTHADPAGLQRAKGMLSVGHDEYWSLEMFQNVQRAVAGGLSVAFLSGNTCCGRILHSADLRGGRDRVFERVGTDSQYPVIGRVLVVLGADSAIEMLRIPDEGDRGGHAARF